MAREEVAMLLMRVAWLIVILVGLFVLSLVFGLQLFHRLGDGQRVLDDAPHLFRDDLVVAQRNASDAVNLAVNDVLDPIMTEQGGAAAEVPQLITFVSQQTELSEAEVLEVLQENFPHTTAFLLAIPLEEVKAELPEPDCLPCANPQFDPRAALRGPGSELPSAGGGHRGVAYYYWWMVHAGDRIDGRE
jgi:hypothetical protein